MDEAGIYKRLLDILRMHLKVSMPVTEATALLADGVLDSLDFMNYLTRVEEVFGVTISNEELAGRRLGTLGNMVEYLGEKGC